MKYQTWKKALSAFLAAIMIAVMIPISVTAATSGYYTYSVSNGEATITDVDISISGNVTIPSTLGGYPVTSIGDYAFLFCDSLTSVTIPDSVTSIDDRAFYSCYSLTSITIPDSVTSIGDQAFYNTGYYNTGLNWEDNVLYIGKHLIKANTISGEYTVKEGTLTIADSAFLYCTSLTNITIPDSVTSIDDWAFYYCLSLKSITIPDSVTSIGEGAFYFCTSLTSITIPDSVTSIDDWAFYYCDSLTSITIPDSVTSIGDDAFYFCTSLTSVTIGNSVTSIGDRAFSSCKSLTSITIPDSVTSIGYYAFSECTSLTDVYYAGDINDWSKIEIKGGNNFLTGASCFHYNAPDPDSHYVLYTVIKEPTCTNTGTGEYVCPCGYFKNGAVPALEHDTVQHDGKAPTCIEPGYADYETCTRCDYTTYTEIHATGIHIGGTATCTNKAVCDVCKSEYGKIDSNNHDTVSHEGKAPTCTETGWDAYETCSRCDYTTYVEIPETGHHTVQHSAKSPTCTEIGWNAYETCTKCDYTTYIELRKYGHQYENGICIHCGAEDDKINPTTTPGDATGDEKINLSDVSLVLQYIAKWDVTIDTDAADVTDDGTVNLSDVSLILKYIAKWDVVLGK